MKSIQIPDFDAVAAAAAQKRWNSIAKPLSSLGRLEDAVVQIAGITGDAQHRIDKRALIVLCADNGVAGQGVSTTGAEVTTVLARCLAHGNISVCKMAEAADTDVFGVDMGLNADPAEPGLENRRCGDGTGDISVGPAMTLAQAESAINHGIELAERCARQGYKILATGEAGIGNTTTSSAMTSVLLQKPAAEVTGRGAGVSPEVVRKKVGIIEKAIAVNKPDPNDALDILAKLGGFDIAGMAGIFIGGAMNRIPVLADGLISTVAALTAVRLFPKVGMAVMASHVSAEPAATALLKALGREPLICADMRLGEGTGAVAALPLLDLAYAVYDNMLTYEDIAIGHYQPKA